jgi:hypothetical protein
MKILNAINLTLKLLTWDHWNWTLNRGSNVLKSQTGRHGLFLSSGVQSPAIVRDNDFAQSVQTDAGAPPIRTLPGALSL